MTEQDPYQFAKDIAEALDVVLKKHGYFYDRYASVTDKDGFVGACNNGGCEINFIIDKGSINYENL